MVKLLKFVCDVVAELPVVELEVVALPDKEAVIVPALKLPEASLATSVEAVFALVALVEIVTADDPL